MSYVGRAFRAAPPPFTAPLAAPYHSSLHRRPAGEESGFAVGGAVHRRGAEPDAGWAFRSGVRLNFTSNEYHAD